MNAKERMHAVLEGRPIDRMPVWVSYSQLYHQDHFDELTGLPRHQYAGWRYSPPPRVSRDLPAHAGRRSL